MMRKLNKDESFILIIYDIVDDRRRDKLAEYLNGYGYRVQKSCFEAVLTRKQYLVLLKDIPHMVNLKEDSVRIYKFHERSSVTNFGTEPQIDYDVIGIV